MPIRTTRKRSDWAQARGAVVKGAPLHYSAPAERKYRADLEKLIRAMLADYERTLTGTYKAFGAMDASIASQLRILLNALGTKWSDRFARASNAIVERMVGRVNQAEKVSLGASLKDLSGGLTIPVKEMPGDLKDKIIAATAENVALIKSIASQYHTRIESDVLTSVQTGGTGAASLFDKIRETGQVTEKRAKLIAVDQTSKITSAMNTERALAAGVRKFEWIHSGGGREPRPLHVRMNGQIFNYDDPPVIDEKTGERGYPGQLINCRCVARPILDFGE